MSFFSGASNVRISGGEFNVVKGNMNVFDQSRHHTNMNSFNTRNTTTMDSHNNNSKRYYGDPNDYPELPPPGPRDRDTSPPSGPHDYFPPPTIHPAMMQPQFGAPGTRTQNIDSFNVNNDNTMNARNNYSQEYGAPPPRTRRRRRRRPADHSMGEPEDLEEYGDDDEDGSNPSYPPKQTGPSSFGNVSYGNSSFNQGMGGSGFAQRGFPVPPGVPYVNGHRPGTYSTADYLPGQIQPMSPDIQQSIAILMEQVKQQTAPQPQHPGLQPVTQQINDEEYDEEEEEDSDSDEGDSQDMRMRDPLTDNMANLRLNDELLPAISRVKSAPPPEARTNTHLGVPPTRIEPRHAESTQDLPDRLREPFVSATPGGQPAPPHWQNPPVPPQKASSSIPSEFGFGTAVVEGSPIYRNINGDYTKVDQTYNTTNIASGNTQNTLIKDSYNDASIKHYAPPEVKKTGKKQGRFWK